MNNDYKPYTVVSLFCGLGGLDLGFEWEGYKIIWANDFSQDACKSYTINFGIKPFQGDINEIPIEEIPDSDVIIGGPPCQSFSLVGQRQPNDPRGKLVFKFVEIVRAKQPRAFVMENVPGITASRIKGMPLLDTISEEFSDLGYKVIRMKLKATDYLVPQLRHRIILVGCKDSPVFYPNSEDYVNFCYGLKINAFDLSAKAAIGDLGNCTVRGERSTYKEGDASLFANLMREKGVKDVSLHECPRMSDTDKLLVKHIPPGGNYMDIPDDISPGRVLKFKQTGGRTTTYGRLHPDRPAYTINTYFRRPNVGCNFHYSEPRLITPREAMRFQSIPDHFELSYSSQDQRNALIGNAVPPLMARAIAWSLKTALNGKSPHVGGLFSYNDDTIIEIPQ